MQANRQKPFAYERGGRGYVIRSSNKAPRTQFSQNIRGLCPRCKQPYQRLKKYKEVVENGIHRIVKLPYFPCKRCSKSGISMPVVEFPKELMPWKIIDPTALPASRYYRVPFNCQNCATHYSDFCTFGALCDHTAHIPRNGFWCRLCCTKVVEPAPKNLGCIDKKAIKKILQENILYWGDIEIPVVNNQEQFVAEMAAPPPDEYGIDDPGLEEFAVDPEDRF